MNIRSLKSLQLLSSRVVITPVFVVVLTIVAGYPSKCQEFQAIKKCLFINPPLSAKLTIAESNDLKSLRNSIFVSGLAFDEIKTDQLVTEKLKSYNLLIVPAASAKNLSAKQLSALKNALNSGTNLLFDGVSALGNELEITLQEKSEVINMARDLQFPNIPLYWTKPAKVKPIETQGKSYKILCINDSTGDPIAVSGFFGKGKFAFFAAYFDPNTSAGYSRFPFLIETIGAEFDIRPLAECKSMEMYFDPGMRDTVKIDNLVKEWRKNKIKRIHAGGWYYDEDYDYAKLIKSCHENGILVYCWFETPMISRTFWDKHPEWREKTPYGRDAAIDWRLLMNLADTNCRKQVFKEWSDFLKKNDFDGVNFAELYFEPSPVGPNLPENFTPMNQLVRSEYKKLSGFDPVELFNASGPHFWKKNPADWKNFANYRKNLCYELKDHFLDFLTKVKKQKTDFEVMLTVLDVSLTPELSDFIAEDTRNTLKLYAKYKTTMQIEDPSNCWGLTPERYVKMGIYYRKEIKEPNMLLFDCNVVGSHEEGEGGFAAEKPTGEEIRQITYNMSTHISRPVFYSEDQINWNDWQNISCTLARDTKFDAKLPGNWAITATKTVLVHTGSPGLQLKLDGQPWFAMEGDAVIIPKGNHTLEISKEILTDTEIQITSISGELISADFQHDNTEFTYSEDIVPCYVTLSKEPASVYIDGKKTDCEVYRNSGTEFTVRLPAGFHKVKVL